MFIQITQHTIGGIDMKKHTFTMLFIITIGLIYASNAFSQATYFYKMFDDKFPTMRIQWIARNGIGDSLAVPWEQFHIIENGVEKPIIFDCSEKPIPETSVLFLIDCSVSMQDIVDTKTNEKKWDWAKFGVNAFLDSIKFNGDTKIQLVFFANGTKYAEVTPPCDGWRPGTDLELMRKALEQVKTGLGKTDFSLALYGTNIRPFLEMKNRPEDIQRHIIFITDGDPDILFTNKMQDSVIALARDSKTFVHVFSIDKEVNEGLQFVAAQTGGVKSRIQTKAFFKSQIQGLVNRVQRRWFCEMTWQSDYTCDESGRARNLEITRTPPSSPLEKLLTKSFNAPDNSVNNTSADKSQLVFGSSGNGMTEATFELSHNGGKFNVTGVKFEPVGDFIVKDWGGSAPPFEINHGSKRTIKIAYNDPAPTASKKTKLSINIPGYNCDIPQLELVSLCAGVELATYDFSEVPQNTNSPKKLDYAFKNRTAVEIPVTATIKGPDAADFKITSSKTQVVAPAQFMALDIEFSPKSIGDKSAYIEYTLPEGCDGNYKTELKGKGIVNSVEEQQTSGNGTGALLTIEPNPAVNQFKMKFTNPITGSVKMELFDKMGSLIDVLVNKNMPEGSFEAIYNTDNLSSGLYLIRIQTGTGAESVKVSIVK